MTKNLISWLLLLATFSFLLHSCVHDEMISSADPSSKEYHSKSLWKEDEKYIKNVMQVYLENETRINTTNGTPYWDYAVTMGTFDESFLMVPVVKDDKVIAVIQVPRKGSKIHFYYTQFPGHISFFQDLVFAPLKKAIFPENSFAKGRSCSSIHVSVWIPNNPNNDNGPGHWDTKVIVRCTQQDMESCTGIVGPNGECSGGEYPYPGGGNNNEPETQEDPCQKTKAIINNPKMTAGLNELKDQSILPKSNDNYGEKGIKFKADGTPSATIPGQAHSVNFGDKTGYTGGYHNHTVAEIPMLSPPDIDQLLGFARAQGNYGDPTKAYLGMIAPNGMHYVIYFNGSYSDAVVTFTDETLKPFNDRYQTRYGMISSDGNVSNEAIEKFFFKTITDMGLEGKVNLQRIENNGTIKTITKNTDGSINADPCK